jgi:U3 small nucleolar RNA-associated protein 10
LLASASTIDGTQEETDLNIGLIKVLNQVYQRWPEVWEASTSSRLNSNSQDAEELKRLWLIINSVLSGGEITKSIEGGKTGGIFLSSSSPDVAVRLVALNELLATPALRKANPTFVHDTLLARLAETKVGILNALFSPKAVTILHSVLSADEIFTTIQRVIGTPKRSPEVLGSVLKYLAGPFVKAFPTRVHEVFEEVFFSRLLPSMDDYQERVFGWEAFTGSELFQNHPWFGGDFGELDLPTTIDKETLEKVVLELADHAVSLTERISKSIQDLALPQQTLAINFLVARIVIDETTVGADLVDAQDATSQLLALAILGRLVGTRGDMLDVSSSIIEALKIERLGLDAFVQRHALRDGHKAAPHPSEVVRKYFHNALVASRAKKTIQSARKQLIETVYEKSSTRVRGLGLWFNTDSDHYREYNELIRLMYRCAHTGNTPGGKEFGGHLLNPILNIHLRSDPLSFFASIWTDLFSPAGLKIAALQEAGQYLATHSGKTMKPMLDYQSVLPALLVGLQDIEKGVREEAMRSIVLMRDGMPEEGAAGFYGRGTFYGVDEGKCRVFLPSTLPYGFRLKLLFLRRRY